MTRQLPTTVHRAGKPRRSEFAALPRRPVSLLLDRVERHANLGAAFRIADALRLEAVHVCGAELRPDARQFRQAARRLDRWVPWTAWPDAASAAGHLKSRGVRIVAVEMAAGAVDFRTASIGPGCCVAVGGETRGVSEELLALADLVVSIPMSGMGNSLNAATAAAAVLFRHVLDLPLPSDPAPPVGGTAADDEGP